MSTKLGTLTLDLVAKIGSFVGPMQQAEKQTKISFESMRAHANTYGMTIAAAAGSAAVALGSMAVATANQAADLEKFAARAQTTTQEFQKMAVGASALGIEGEQLSSMMKDFNEKMGELTAVGGGGGKDFFDKLSGDMKGGAQEAKGLILEMQKLSGPEALQMYVDKLEDAGVSQQEMSFYLESMASDLTDLYPLLANGGEGMKLYGDMAERAGIIMTDQTKEAALALKDQMFMLDLQMQGAKNQLVSAVIPAFVDVADAFFGGSEQGLQFTTVADGIAESLRFVAKMAIGVVTTIQLAGKAMGAMGAVYGSIQNNKDWYELGPLGYAKALYDARGEIASIGKSYVSDADKMLQNAAAKMDAIDKRVGSTKANQLRGIREIQQRNTSNAAGLQDVIDKNNKATAKSANDAKKSQSDLNRVLEERNRIEYEYSTAYRQQEIDLQKELQRLRANGMSQYVDLAKNRYAEQKKLSEMQFAWEVSEHRFTENQKLAYSFNIKEQEIKADEKLTAAQKQLKLQALDETFKLEQSKLKISQDKELLETKKLWMSAGDYAREYYDLVRKEILNTVSYSPEMKDAKIKQANLQQGMEQNAEREQVWGDYKSMMGMEDSPYQQDMDLLAKAREQMLITEQDYQQKRLQLQTMYGSQYGATFAGLMQGLVSEGSTAYAVLGAMQKGFTLYSVAMSSVDAIGKAWASAAFPYNMPAVAMATMETGLLQAAVSAITPTGYATGGLITGKGTGTSDDIPIWASNGEFMMKASAVNTLGTDVMNTINNNPEAFKAKVLDPSTNKTLQAYNAQAQEQARTQNTIDNKIKVLMVDNRDDLMNSLYGTGGEKVIVHHIKRNRSQIKALLG
ncbi:hypothetical protein [Acinetobacter sp.]|uniref:hypothetical protein n=1 Tax=Acinetobacter sp. TaxID=472 RepID=UPI003D0153E6